MGNAPFAYLEETMNQITTPNIRLLTYQEAPKTGLQVQTLILNHNGNNYHFPGSTGDTIHVFTESLGIYVLTINKSVGHISLNAFLVPEPDPINSIYLHNHKEIREYLGVSGELRRPEYIIQRLIDCLY